MRDTLQTGSNFELIWTDELEDTRNTELIDLLTKSKHFTSKHSTFSTADLAGPKAHSRLILLRLRCPPTILGHVGFYPISEGHEAADIWRNHFGLHATDKIVEIDSRVVHKDFQNKGYGKFLSRWALKLGLELSPFLVRVVSEENIPSLKSMDHAQNFKELARIVPPGKKQQYIYYAYTGFKSSADLN